MMTFDYTASAELFMPKRKGGPRPPLSYRRFATAAEAIRFAVEELPAVRTLGAWMRSERSASTAMTSGAYTRAPVIRSAVACGNRGEIIGVRPNVVANATSSARDG
jgi:hypothetical protein